MAGISAEASQSSIAVVMVFAVVSVNLLRQMNLSTALPSSIYRQQIDISFLTLMSVDSSASKAIAGEERTDDKILSCNHVAVADKSSVAVLCD
jgi:hypothetical protein